MRGAARSGRGPPSTRRRRATRRVHVPERLPAGRRQQRQRRGDLRPRLLRVEALARPGAPRWPPPGDAPGVVGAPGEGRDEGADRLRVVVDASTSWRPARARRRSGRPSWSTGTMRGSRPRSCRSTPSMFRKPPRIASARRRSAAGSRLRPTFTSVDVDGRRARRLQDRLQVVALVRDARGGDGLALQVGGGRRSRPPAARSAR